MMVKKKFRKGPRYEIVRKKIGWEEKKKTGEKG